MNVLFFFPDEMRASALECYGNPVSRTPNYNRLASAGTCFENEYVANPVCVGSRCAMLTGWYPHVNGYRSLLHFIGKDQPNFLRDMKKSGYNVQLYGKNHVLDEEALKLSVNEYKGINFSWRKDNKELRAEKLPIFSKKYHMLLDPMPDEAIEEMVDTVTVNAGVEFLDQHQKGDDPFMLFISINNPHAPYTIPEKYYHMYDWEQMTDLRKKNLSREPGFRKLIRQYSMFDEVSDEVFQKCAAVYLGMVRYCDDMLGRLLDALERNGLAEDTIVVTSSDHGDYAGDYGLIEKWPNAFEDSLEKVPLIIRVPGQPGGHRVQELVSQLDIFPTLFDFLGLETGHDQFGRSLRKQVEGEAGDPERAVYAEGGYSVREQQCFEGTERDYSFLMREECLYYPKMVIQQERQEAVCRATMMRKGDWKLIIRTNEDHELYDLSRDPKEENNRYDDDDCLEIREKMKEEMLMWYIETSDVVPRLE